MPKKKSDSESEIRINTLEHKVGINKEGLLTGNGLINELSTIKKDADLLHDKLNCIKTMQIELNMRFDVLENDIKELTNSMTSIKKDMEDNINLRTIGKLKNIIIGFAGLLAALGVIGSFLVRIFKE